MGSVSIEGAEQLLVPPQDGLPHLRLDRAGEMRLAGGSLTCVDDRIAAFSDDRDAVVRIDATGAAVIPGFVDCHTHLPFAGWRSEEYAQKVAGVPYERISRAGGGIRSSATALASASDEQVLDQAVGVAGEMLRSGTTTLETKSGYGLSIAQEDRALRLAGALAVRLPQRVNRTALLAHAVPPDTDADEWIGQVEREAPRLAAESGFAALDLYVETIAFGLDHLRRMGALARSLGVDLRCHAEQFSTMRSVQVALEQGARSVDHLACLHPDDLRALAAAECAAVLLPGAEFLGAERVAPGRELADRGAIGVLATDCNPGTSPVSSMPVVIGLAVRRYGWTTLEALVAATLNAAWVLRRSDDVGSIEVGKRADVVVLDCPLDHLPYRFGRDPVAVVLAGGEVAYVRPDQRWRVRS